MQKSHFIFAKKGPPPKFKRGGPLRKNRFEFGEAGLNSVDNDGN